MNRKSITKTIVLHILGCLGMLAYCACLYAYADQREALGKSKGRDELFWQLDKDGIAVPETYRPRVSKADLIGPMIDLQAKRYFLFWPALVLQGVVVWRLTSLLPPRRQAAGSQADGADGGKPVR